MESGYSLSSPLPVVLIQFGGSAQPVCRTTVLTRWFTRSARLQRLVRLARMDCRGQGSRSDSGFLCIPHAAKARLWQLKRNQHLIRNHLTHDGRSKACERYSGDDWKDGGNNGIEVISVNDRKASGARRVRKARVMQRTRKGGEGSVTSEKSTTGKRNSGGASGTKAAKGARGARGVRGA